MLNRVWGLADREGERRSTRPDLVFDPVGLILIRPLEKWGYDSTPVNSQSFAHTGGDGVHFGLIDLGVGISEDSPVVMTVPMAANPKNVILGENLFDFLCLGCESGYFMLEQLSYDWAFTVGSIAQFHKHVAHYQEATTKGIRNCSVC